MADTTVRRLRLLARLLFLLSILSVLFLGTSTVLAADEEDSGEDDADSSEDSEDDQEDADLLDEDQEAEDAVPLAEVPAEVEQKPEKKPLFGRYGRWLKRAEKMAMEELDLWGASSTVPQGFLVGLAGWGTMRPFQRFDQDRKLVDILPILSFDDPFHDEGKFFKFDFNISGKGSALLASFMYGITDHLTVGVSTNFMVVEIKVDPIFTPGTVDYIGVSTLDEFYVVLEALGRPRPKTRYKTDGVDCGDTVLNLTWNYFRTDYFSTAVTGNVFLPTSHRADPNSNLTFGLGPDIDTGYGAWGVGMNVPLDFRLPKPVKWVSFSITGEGAYFFRSTRKSPDFLPIDTDVRDWIEAQGVDVDFFQDLTDMGSTYYYTPGPWAAVSGTLGVGPVSVTYRHGWGWEASYDSDSEGFKKMIDFIGLVGNGDDGKLIFSVSLPLTPIYLPALAQFRFEYQTDGRNTLVYRDIYGAGIGFFIPLAPPERYKLSKRSGK